MLEDRNIYLYIYIIYTQGLKAANTYTVCPFIMHVVFLKETCHYMSMLCGVTYT